MAARLGLVRWSRPLAALFLVSCGGAPVTELPRLRTAGGGEMVLIPAGELDMGSEGGDGDEAPVHRVRIGAFLIDRSEVTQEQLGRPRPRPARLWRCLPGARHPGVSLCEEGRNSRS